MTWDRVDPEKVSPRISRSVNRSFLFHPSGSKCSIANVAFRFANSEAPRNYTLHYGTLGVVLPVLSNMAAVYADDRGNPKQLVFFG